MKNLLIFYSILLCFLFAISLYSQTPKWVSTEVQKRNVVFEHFTGTNYKGFPMGDKEANALAKEFSNKFIIINNYYDGVSGTFTGPIRVFELDLKTDEGQIVGDEIGYQKYNYWRTTNYPLASINRSTNPWAMTSDKWRHTAISIMKQNSIVNVYVKPEINYQTRELTVEVEYYYTDDSPETENSLIVMLLQNEIEDFMYGGLEKNPEYAINDTLYRHMHVLRKVISKGGIWGDLITNTKKGSYECRKYTIVLPDSIRNVPLDLTNLEIAAFISENTGNIYTGHKAVIEVPEDIRTDLAVEDLTEYNNIFKIEPIYPKIKITNNSDLPVTKFDISYIISNTHNFLNPNNYEIKIYDTFITKRDTYSGTLNKGETAIIEFPAISRSDYKGSSTCITASVSNIYSNDISLVDINSKDNIIETDKRSLIDTAYKELEITFENSDTLSNTGGLPVHTIFDYSLNPYFLIDNRSGANNTKNAVVFLLWQGYKVMFKPGYIMFGEIDCKDKTNKILSYYYAYSDYKEKTSSQPKVVIEISKDFGETWQKISENFCQETVGDSSSFASNTLSLYLPSSDEYKHVQIDLSDYANENFLLRIGGVPGSSGNALWLDEISIKNAPEESIVENTKLSIYPNPASNILHINNDNLLGEEYKIYDMSGKLIINGINNTNEINIENLSIGTYSIKIKDSIFSFIKE
ncbi:MAG: Omp28-related outer membrane protein [Bacteroidetes bacterium]|nr:Omp28-related outer membrane protein [Bacteroidota bacterium]